MRTETRTVQIGEWLGDVPDTWDYDGFYESRLSMPRNWFDESVRMFKEMQSALRRGAKVWATQSGGYEHEVYGCGLYDGWVYWFPRPCYTYSSPIGGADRDEFYNLRGIRIEEPSKEAA